MKRTLNFFAVVAMLSAVASCQKAGTDERTSSTTPNGQFVLHLELDASKDISNHDTDTEPTPESKVSYDWNNNVLEFEEDDKLQIMLGKWKDASDKAQGVIYSNQLLNMTSHSGATASFRGDINLDPDNTGTAVYSVSDILAAAVVKSVNNNWRVNYRSSNLTIYSARKDTQTQAEGGVFSSGDTFLLSGKISNPVLDPESNTLTASPVTLAFRKTSALEFHVYSSNADYTAESVKSVRIDINNSSARVSTELHLKASDLSQLYINGRSSNGKVTLTTPAKVGSDQNSALPIWMQAYSGTMPVTKITVVTDKATYVKTYSEAKSINASGSNFIPLYCDIGDAEFVRTTP